jgi:hypothetical protein
MAELADCRATARPIDNAKLKAAADLFIALSLRGMKMVTFSV